MKFQCKYCNNVWELSTFSQIDDIQKVQCSHAQPFQNHVLIALIR